MERVEFKKNISDSLINLQQTGLKVALDETRHLNCPGKNSIIYILSVKTNDDLIRLRLDHIWGDSTPELITIWHEINRYDSSIFTENKGHVLQALWKEKYPESNFMLARSHEADLIIGTKLKVDELNPEILTQLISTIIEDIPHAEQLTKRFLRNHKHFRTLDRVSI